MTSCEWVHVCVCALTHNHASVFYQDSTKIEKILENYVAIDTEILEFSKHEFIKLRQHAKMMELLPIQVGFL